MTQAMINPNILSWARTRAGLSVPELAQKLNVSVEKALAWEQGEERPSFKQAQNFAKSTHISFGYLFLQKPPEDDVPIPDLRTIGDYNTQNISIDLRDTIRDVLQRQAWFQDYQRERNADPINVVGSLSIKTPVNEIVFDMKKNLGLMGLTTRGNWEEYTRHLITRIESLGILVMRSSMVGSNNHRLLNINEFRGFAISDKYAPIIFINTADYPEARLFTLIHELTHIWLGESGISDVEITNHKNIEKLCNAVAAEFLTPKVEFIEKWENHQENNWQNHLLPLSNYFHVSKWVIARRALEFGFISNDAYWIYVNKMINDYKNRKKDGAPSYARLQTIKVSKRLAQAVVSEALSGRMLLRDAWHLIGIKPDQLAVYAHNELGI